MNEGEAAPRPAAPEVPKAPPATAPLPAKVAAPAPLMMPPLPAVKPPTPATAERPAFGPVPASLPAPLPAPLPDLPSVPAPAGSAAAGDKAADEPLPAPVPVPANAPRTQTLQFQKIEPPAARQDAPAAPALALPDSPTPAPAASAAIQNETASPAMPDEAAPAPAPDEAALPAPAAIADTLRAPRPAVKPEVPAARAATSFAKDVAADAGDGIAPVSAPSPAPQGRHAAAQDVRLVFAPGTYELDAEAAGVLGRDVLPYLAAHKDATMTVRAFAGADPKRLSGAKRIALSRALFLREYLIGKGVSSARIDVQILGADTDIEPKDRIDITFSEG